MTKLFRNPYFSVFFYKKALFNYSLQNNMFSYLDISKFSKVVLSINMPKNKVNSYNLIRSVYLLYVITGFRPRFSQNKRKTSTTVMLTISGRKIFSVITFFYFLANSERFRIISTSSCSNNGIDFSFHDPSSLFDFRDSRFDYHNWPFKVRVSFYSSSKINRDLNMDLLSHDINFPRYLL